MADRGRVGSLQVGSKRCAQKVMRRNHDLHRSAVEGIKPAIDRAPPVAHQLEHLRHNLKKERLLEDRYMEIDRENKVLLGKMSEIMRQPSVFVDAPRSEKLSAKGSSKGHVTLNRNARKQEMTRITLENQAVESYPDSAARVQRQEMGGGPQEERGAAPELLLLPGHYQAPPREERGQRAQADPPVH